MDPAHFIDSVMRAKKTSSGSNVDDLREQVAKWESNVANFPTDDYMKTQLDSARKALKSASDKDPSPEMTVNALQAKLSNF